MAAAGDRELWAEVAGAADVSVRTRLALSIVLAILTAILPALAPLALKGLVDDLSGAPSAASALYFLGVYIALLAAGRVAAQAQTYVFATGDQRLQLRLSSSAFDRLLRLPMAFHLERQAGSLIQTHSLALQGVRTLVTLTGFILLPAAIQVAVMLVVVAGLFQGWLWLVLAVAMAGYVVVFTWGVRRIVAPMQAALASQIDAGGLFADSLSGIESVKSSVAESRLVTRYADLAAATEHRWRACFSRRLETGLAVAAIYVLSLGCMLWLGVSGVAASQLTVGDFVLLNAYMLQVISPLELTGFAFRDLAQGLGYLSGWRKILLTPTETNVAEPARPPRSAATLTIRPPAIRFEHVSFAYEPNRAILSGVDFSVPAGGAVAIVGVSGAGKSSLLRLLQRQFAPTSGRILLDGRSVADMDIDLLRGSMAVVAQDVGLFNDTLRYNLLFARPDASADALQNAIHLAKLGELVSRLPDKLESRIGERGFKLSGGERQRVAIARAVLRDSPILVLDEATSSLDSETERTISADLMAAARGRTTLIVTHRLALAAHADTILVLENGRVIEQGCHSHLIKADGMYSRLWRSQTGAGGVASAEGD